MSATVGQKARKGDLVLVERTTRDYVIGQPLTERTSYTFAVVASATREGIVKSYRSIGWGDALLSESAQPAHFVQRETLRVMPASEIDVMGVIAAAKLHHWPNHPGQPMPFDSLDAARECARPYRTERAA